MKRNISLLLCMMICTNVVQAAEGELVDYVTQDLDSTIKSSLEKSFPDLKDDEISQLTATLKEKAGLDDIKEQFNALTKDQQQDFLTAEQEAMQALIKDIKVEQAGSSLADLQKAIGNSSYSDDLQRALKDEGFTQEQIDLFKGKISSAESMPVIDTDVDFDNLADSLSPDARAEEANAEAAGQVEQAEDKADAPEEVEGDLSVSDKDVEKALESITDPQAKQALREDYYSRRETLKKLHEQTKTAKRELTEARQALETAKEKGLNTSLIGSVKVEVEDANGAITVTQAGKSKVITKDELKNYGRTIYDGEPKFIKDEQENLFLEIKQGSTTLRMKVKTLGGKLPSEVDDNFLEAAAAAGSSKYAYQLPRSLKSGGTISFGTGRLEGEPGYRYYDKDEIAALRKPRGANGVAPQGSLASLEDAEHGAYLAERDANHALVKVGMSIKRSAQAFADKSLDFVQNIGTETVAVLKKIYSFIGHVSALIFQSLAFTLPNIINQQAIAAQQLQALLATVASPQKFGNIWLQIPPQLISKDNPSRSVFVYVMVPHSNGGRPFGASFFTDDFLKKAQYFVVVSGQGVWGKTYLGSPDYTGQMLHLNSGWILAGEGISVNASNPYVPLLPALSGTTVSAFLDSLFSQGQAVSLVAQQGLQDWLPLSMQKFLHIAKGPRAADITDSPIIATMFTSVKTSSGYVFPPLIFHDAIASARSSTTLSNFGGIALKQAAGTGPLNALLQPGITWDNDTVKSALQSLYNAQVTFVQTTNKLSGTVDQIKEQQRQAIDSLIAAQKQAVSAITDATSQGGTINTSNIKDGFSLEEDPNLYNYYIYEIDPKLNSLGVPTGTMTPSLAALYNSKQILSVKNSQGKATALSSLPPIKEYMVCLDADFNIIPLKIPMIIPSTPPSVTASTQKTSAQKKSGSSQQSKTYSIVYQENPDIAYLVSLTTGFVYQANDPSDKNHQTSVLLPVVNSDNSPNVNFGLQVYKALYNTLVAGADTIGIGALNQIGSMSSYLNTVIQDGPIKLRSGFIIERVPLEKLAQYDSAIAQDNAIDAQNALSSILSGVTIKPFVVQSYAQQVQKLLNKYTPSALNALLPYLYIYKVSNPDGTGALSYTHQGKFYDIPDYVVAAGFEGDAQAASLSQASLNIIPYGSGLMVNPNGIVEVSPGKPIIGFFSLITGEVKDQGYETLPKTPNNYVDVVYKKYVSPLEDPTNTALIGGTHNQGSVASSGGAVRSKRFFLGTVYMPGIVNPNNYFIKDGKRVFNDSMPLNIPPFYYAFSSTFSCPSASLFSPISITGLSPNVTPPQYLGALTTTVAVQPIPYGIMPALPSNFSGFDAYIQKGPQQKQTNPLSTQFPDMLTTFAQWKQSMLVTDYFIGQEAMGPFAFAKGYNPVYLTATSLNDVINGNYFYTATGFPSTDIFVCAQPSSASQTSGSTNQQTVTVPSVGELVVGGPYNPDTTAYIINLANGFVYTPYSNKGIAASGYPQNILENTNPVCQKYFVSGSQQDKAQLQALGCLCSVQNVKQVDVASVVNAAFAYQKATYKGGQPSQSLMNLITNATAAYQAIVDAYTAPITIAGLELVTTQEQINNQTYVYAKKSPQIASANACALQDAQKTTTQASNTDNAIVVIDGDSSLFDNADDYFVTAGLYSGTNDFGASPQIINSQTYALMSLVTGTVYYNQPGTGWTKKPHWYVSYQQTINPGFNPKNIAKTLLPKIYGSLDQTLIDRIMCLSNAYFTAAPSASQAQQQSNTVTEQTVQNLQQVSNQLFIANQKYYVVATPLLQPGESLDISKPFTLFTFNDTNNQEDSRAGAYYLITPLASTDSSSNPTSSYNILKTSEISGFMLETMRAHNGVTVEQNGVQTLSVPVSEFAMPNPDTTAPFVTVADGKVTTNTMKTKTGNPMQLVSGITNPQVDTTQGMSYYYYYHTGIGSYFALVIDTQGHVVGTDPSYTTQTEQKRVYDDPYFVNIATGDKYDLYGKPQKQKVLMAFPKLSPYDNQGVVDVVPFLDAKNLPTVQQLQSAKVVYSSSQLGKTSDATNTWNIVQVAGGKYYLKKTVMGTVVDQYGNYINNATVSLDQYFDFNYTGHLTSSGQAVSQDTGFGLFLQIGQYSSDDNSGSTNTGSDQSSAGNQPQIKNGDPIVVPVNYMVDDDLMQMRLYYGVTVNTSGQESLVTPQTNGIYTKTPLFMWKQTGMHVFDQATNYMYNDGSGYQQYTQIPYSDQYSFLVKNGTVLGITASNQNPLIVTYSYQQGQSTSSSDYTVQQSVFTLYGSQSNSTTLSASSSTQTSSVDQIMMQALEQAQNNQYIQFQKSYQISQSGTADGTQVSVIENMLSPVTITINGTDYLQAQVPGVSYNYTSSGDGNDALLQKIATGPYIPFVAQQKPIVQSSDFTKTSTLNNQTSLFFPGITLCGVMQQDTQALQMVVANFTNQYQMYSPAQTTQALGTVFNTNPPSAYAFGISVPSVPTTYIPASDYIAVSYKDELTVNYDFVYEQASLPVINSINSAVTLAYTMQGEGQLIQNIPYTSLNNVTVPANLSDVAAYIKGVTQPQPRILCIPMSKDIVAAKFSSSSQTSNTTSSALPTQQAVAQAYSTSMLGTLSDGSKGYYYVDYVDGIVFKLDGTGSSAVLKPAGLRLDTASMKVLHGLYNNAIASYSPSKGLALLNQSDYLQQQKATQQPKQLDEKSLFKGSSLQENPTSFSVAQ